MLSSTLSISLSIWAALAVAVAVPVALAAASPYLAYREPVYIVAGFAGIVAMALLLVQPLLAANLLPGLGPLRARAWHRRSGIALVAAVAVHVAGLYVVSPPDVVDALTFASPTPFSLWGVIAMWTVLATALTAALRRRARPQLSPRSWRAVHVSLATVIAAGTVLHAWLIEGAMEPVSKAVLAALVVAATAWVVVRTARPARF